MGFGDVLKLRVGRDGGIRSAVVDTLKFTSSLANVGEAGMLVIYAASTTH
jgi:O-acetylhomoserine/O-acetylserine sulfhydrylase-like pyridoxal-dependent enzyme